MDVLHPHCGVGVAVRSTMPSILWRLRDGAASCTLKVNMAIPYLPQSHIRDSILEAYNNCTFRFFTSKFRESILRQDGVMTMSSMYLSSQHPGQVLEPSGCEIGKPIDRLLVSGSATVSTLSGTGNLSRGLQTVQCNRWRDASY